ncbi:hypothetical protein F4808DRAFT_461021 [Astrocystis sublimbata]|nr:hypothetical protein F4808DRAFT_461021 [Astrocystis sublimbata]
MASYHPFDKKFARRIKKRLSSYAEPIRKGVRRLQRLWKGDKRSSASTCVPNYEARRDFYRQDEPWHRLRRDPAPVATRDVSINTVQGLYNDPVEPVSPVGPAGSVVDSFSTKAVLSSPRASAMNSTSETAIDGSPSVISGERANVDHVSNISTIQEAGQFSSFDGEHVDKDYVNSEAFALEKELREAQMYGYFRSRFDDVASASGAMDFISPDTQAGHGASKGTCPMKEDGTEVVDTRARNSVEMGGEEVLQVKRRTGRELDRADVPSPSFGHTNANRRGRDIISINRRKVANGQ